MSDAQVLAEAGTETPPGPAEQQVDLDPQAGEEALGLQPDHRRLIQSGLAVLGFDPGPVDGVFGQRSRAAIGKWQASQGRPVTGYLDVEATKILARIGIEAPPPSNRREASKQAAMETLTNALRMAGEIDDHYSRAQLLVRISDVLVTAGDIPRAMRSLSLASAAIERSEVEFNVYIGSSIAAVQAKAGDIRAALAIAERFEYDSDRGLVLTGIAASQAEAGDVKGAFATSERIALDSSRADALAWIAVAQERNGNTKGAAQSIQGALAIAERIAHDRDRLFPLQTILDAQMRTGDTNGAEETIEKALAIAERIGSDIYLDGTLSRIARAQAQAGDVRAALATVERLADESDVARTLMFIARAQAKAGDVRAALATVERIAVEDRDSALAHVASGQAEAGDVQGALATAERISENKSRAWALVRIARGQIESGAR